MSMSGAAISGHKHSERTAARLENYHYSRDYFSIATTKINTTTDDYCFPGSGKNDLKKMT